MTAVINGEAITHEIKQKDYDKFLAVDDLPSHETLLQGFQ